MTRLGLISASEAQQVTVLGGLDSVGLGFAGHACLADGFAKLARGLWDVSVLMLGAGEEWALGLCEIRGLRLDARTRWPSMPSATGAAIRLVRDRGVEEVLGAAGRRDDGAHPATRHRAEAAVVVTSA
jgi:hypothetical protein